MFDLSFYELLIFGIIALIVLGPEKLPQAVRTAGTYYAKFRRTVGTIRAEMEAELDLAETRQQMEAELAKIRQAEADMQKEMARLRGSMQEFEQQTSQLSQSTPTTPHSESISLDKDKANTNNHIALDPNTSSSASNEPKTTTNPELNKQGIDSHAYRKEPCLNEIPPPTRPWQNMWFLLSDYDRKNRLPPAPLLPNYKANPLLNAVPMPVNSQQIPLSSQLTEGTS